MAYYEFECEKCHKQFTVKQTFDEHDRQPKPKCPQCGSQQKIRQVVAAVHVKTSKKS